MPELDNILSEKLGILKAGNLLRTLRTTERLEGAEVIVNGKKLVSFSCNDYLGLSQDKRVEKAAAKYAKKYGAGGGASRLITGNNPLYDELETNLAKLCGSEAAVVFSSGYMANIGTLSALVDKDDLIIADKFSHSCIIEGSQLSGAEFKRFPHNNLEVFEAMISKHRNQHKNCLVITESVFSMDGDTPNLQKMQEICEKYDSWLMVDYAHDLNYFSKNSKLQKNNLIKMGTLSKAIGSYGGYIAGSKTLVDYIKSTAKSLIFTTSLPPASVAASIKSLEIISKEKWRIKKALNNAEYFTYIISKNLPELELDNSISQIVPLIVGGIEDTLKLSDYLYEKGFLVAAIRPPTVPVNTSRLRFSFSASHDKKQIDKLCKAIISYYKK